MELDVKQLITAIQQIAEEKNLESEQVKDVVQQALAAAYKKDFGTRDQEVRVELNEVTGGMTAFTEYEVVEDVENPEAQMTIEQAKEHKKDAILGDIVSFKDSPTVFGRVAAQTAKQVILQKLREAEREVVLGEYEDKIGTVLNGSVTRVEARLVRIELGKAQGIIPMSEQIRGEYYSPGQRLKVYLKEVERTGRGPQLILSRAAPEFIKDLFANEVPEMENGAVEIKAIAREAGVRTKLAVSSTVQGVDPVGTFVGGHGTRVQAVMGEIGDDEKIDIIQWNDDIYKFIANALSPTEVASVVIDEKNNKATVYVNEDQLSVAIGRGGQNVRLASKLVGLEIDVTKRTSDTPEQVVKTEEPKVEEKAQEQPKKEVNDKPKRPASKAQLETNLLDAVESQPDEPADSAE
jgi:N utilization substance protein A